MRVAAGVLLILAAVINLFASLGYLGGGAATSTIGNVSESAIEASLIQSGDMTAEEARASSEVSGSMKGAGGLLMGMGVFLLVSVGILIAGAVFLFQSKNPQFATAAGVMALVGEGLGMAITSFGVMNLIGLVAGVLTIIAARSYSSETTPEPELA